MKHFFPMVFLIICCIFITFVFTVAHAAGESATTVIIPNDPNQSPWLGFSKLVIKESYPAFPQYKVQWIFESGQPGDMKIQQMLSNNKNTLVLLSGNILLISGLKTKQASEMDTLDYALLSMDLVKTFMDAAFPSGPNTVTHEKKVLIQNNNNPIHVNNTNGGAIFSSPWRVNGIVKPGNNNTIFYVLNFEYKDRNSKQPIDMLIYGYWQFNHNKWQYSKKEFDNNWQKYQLGLIVKEFSGVKYIDFSAQSLP